MHFHVWIRLALLAMLIASEAVVQFSTPDFSRAWHLVRDANYNVVAVVDDAGDVRRQRSFNPYGELAYEETFAAGGGPSWNPVVRVGHQGLFFDRLNGDYASQPIATGSIGLYHNRNRSYSPHLGRFVQSDPNATGAVTAFHGSRGRSPVVGVDSPELLTLLGDGFSLYQAYRSSPGMGVDPEGLFFSGLLSLFAPMHTLDIYADYTAEVVGNGVSAKGAVDAMLNDYGWGVYDAIDAVLDWDTPDDALNGMSVGGMNLTASDGGWMGGSYAFASAFTGGVAVGESHHIIPRFLMEIDDAANRLRLPHDVHGQYHRALEEAFRHYGLNPPNSRGAKNWKRRFLNRDVKGPEIAKIREALDRAARNFDDVTSGIYDMRGRTLRALNARNYLNGALDAFRAVRRGIR